jgi:medium-chain acyl-[acyl-carrier-protein] hydrolase
MKPAQRNAWLPLYQHEPDANLRLFCFPHAGGNAQAFRTWPKWLGPKYEVCAVQTPGRWNRYQEPPISHFPTLVEMVTSALKDDFAQPFALFGHSVGALLAFEVARDLRRKGLPEPQYLFLAGRRAPNIHQSEPPIRSLSDEALIAFIADRFGAIPEPVLNDPEMLKMIMPLLRADLELAQNHTYVAEPPLKCPIAVFGGTSDRTTLPSWLEAWREQTSAHFNVEIFPGGHFFLDTARDHVLTSVDRLCRAATER